MKLTHIDNACCIYESNGFRLLCDPWLTDGAFEGSWMHYPPLSTRIADVVNSDALYISHLHPDHYDPATLKHFRRDIPIIVLDHGSNFLHKMLQSEGFNNLVKVKDKQSVVIGPMEVTVYAPFTKHPFDNSELGNFLDSAIVVETNGKVILNANDNTPSVESARALRENHGRFTVAQLKDSLASAYPSCFINLSVQEKLSEANRLIKRQLTAMCEVAKELETEWFQPFAGDYQLGGYLADKNRFLGVAGKQYSAQFIASRGIKPLILNEQGSIDLVTGELKASYRENIIPYETWINLVSKKKFDYELEPEVGVAELKSKIVLAFDKLAKFQEKFNYYPDINVWVNGVCKYLGKQKGTTVRLDVPQITFRMDNRLLLRILDRKSHWNNAEVGCHIEIERVPNVYDPDLVNAMCFFHC